MIESERRIHHRLLPLPKAGEARAGIPVQIFDAVDHRERQDELAK